MSEEPDEGPQPWRNEAPVSSLLLPILLIAAFALQSAAPWIGLAASPDRLIWDGGLSALALKYGHWWTLVSHIFLHGGVAHIFMNTAVAFGVAAPVARILGGGGQGVVRFFVFFLLCGVLAGLTAVALHPNGAAPLIGASGAICGLWGAATRAGPPDEPLLSPWRREAWRAYWPFLLVNVVLMAALTQVGLPISWEAHLGGFVSGLLLIDLFVPRGSHSAQ